MSQLLTGNSALDVHHLAKNITVVPEGKMGTSDISQLSVVIECKFGVCVLLAEHGFFFFLFFFAHCYTPDCLLAPSHFIKVFISTHFFPSQSPFHSV